MLRRNDDEASEDLGNDAERESSHLHKLLVVGFSGGGGYQLSR